MITPYLLILLVVLLYMTGWFLLALRRRRNGLADIAWGGGFIAAALTKRAPDRGNAPRLDGGAAGGPLGGAAGGAHRPAKSGKGRGRALPQVAGGVGARLAPSLFLQVFLLQGFLIYLICLPVIRICFWRGPSSLTVSRCARPGRLDGRVLFRSRWGFPAGPIQERPGQPGKIIQQGLWRYSRHPNYFGEVTLWWGIYLMALPVPGGWMTIIGPLTITFLILKVSGIPLLESKYAENAAFQAYARRTSAFFPLPPRKEG